MNLFYNNSKIRFFLIRVVRLKVNVFCSPSKLANLLCAKRKICSRYNKCKLSASLARRNPIKNRRKLQPKLEAWHIKANKVRYRISRSVAAFVSGSRQSTLHYRHPKGHSPRGPRRNCRMSLDLVGWRKRFSTFLSDASRISKLELTRREYGPNDRYLWPT